ncbi:hypothetical protein SERMPA_00089 (plasmid) [Serratia marcescens]|nr:Uncharacterised protein [Serratia marcescens]
MAGVRPLCSTATPGVRSVYGEGKFPDRCHSVCMCRSDRTVVHHARHRDRYRRRCSFSYQGRRLAARVQRHCYQDRQDRHRSSRTAHPTGSGHKRTPRPTGISSTEWRFSPPTSHAGISAAVYSGIAWLPAAQLPGGRVWLLRWPTAHRYVSGLPLLSPFACLYRRRGFFAARGPNMRLLLTGHRHALR